MKKQMLAAAALVLAATPLTAQQISQLPDDPRDPRLNQGAKPAAVASGAMVATQLPVVTETALNVLRQGGNAVDAMVAAVFMQHVNDYHQVSHFGAMSALYYDAKTKRTYALNAVSARPRSDRSEGSGDASKVAIGGVVRGLEALARRFGTQPWASLLEPAIASAEEGALVTSFMYGVNYALMEEGDLLRDPEARKFYMPEGHLVPVGRRWKMPELANTLKAVAAEGADYLYTGAWGRKFVERANKKGYRVSLEDMAEYQPQWQEPVRFTYRGRTLLGSPPPDTGGLVVGSCLTILENFDLRAMGHYSRSPETLEIMARAFGRVTQETRYAIQDPLSFQVPGDVWLDKNYGRMGARFVRQTMLRPDVELDSSEAEATGDGESVLTQSPREGFSGELGSNHNVIVDREGNWISLLHTGHGGAPGIFIDGVRATGSGARARTSGPGRRLVLPITAIMILDADGVPWLAMGTPGSPPQPVTEVLVNILDFGMPPAEAADAPRFWALRNQDQLIEMESRLAPGMREKMAARGLKIRDIGEYNWHTGSMQIVWRDKESGRLHAATDPRRLGFVGGIE